MTKEMIYDILKGLSFERVCGTSKEDEAADYLINECKKMGIEAVKEEFEIPNPTVSHVSFKMVEPYEKEYYCTGQGFSGNTGKEGITAPLAYIHNGEDEYLEDIKGKIVLSTGGMRGDLRMKLVEKGALGYIVTWGGIFDDETMKSQVPHRFARLYLEDDSNFPGVMMNLGTAEQLIQDDATMVHLELAQDPSTKATSRNVVATIEGTTYPDEQVIFTAHYDSVEFSSGAWDNATGSINILELCRYFKENPPKRTCKFVWCGSEEIGLRGSYAYTQMHKEDLEKMILCINFDMTGVALGNMKVFGSCDESLVNQAVHIAKCKGMNLGKFLGLASTDSTSFAVNKVPAISFGTMSVRNGAEIHSNRDTIDRINMNSFMDMLEVSRDFAIEVVNAKVNIVPRELPKQALDQIELNLKTHQWK